MRRPAPSAWFGLLAVLGALWCGSLLFDRSQPPAGPAPGGLGDPDPLVRVRLEAPSRDDGTEIGLRGRWTVRDEAGQILHEGHGFEGQIRLDSAGAKLGPWRVRSDAFRVETEGDAALSVGGSRYDGALLIRLQRDDRRLPVKMELLLELPLEAYLAGVVAGELPTQAVGAAAALEAQAIAARSYALWTLRGGREVLSDSPADQRFRSIDWITPEALAAVAATRGLVLCWEDRLLPGWYHANCGGATADAAAAGFAPRPLAPLVGVADPECAAASPWERRVAAAVLDGIARRDGLGDSLERLLLRRRDVEGRLIEAELAGEAAVLPYLGEELRRDFGLPSCLWLALAAEPDGGLSVRGRGRGHGVGMCQDGALRLARAGASRDQILARYYPGGRIAALGELDRARP